MTDLPPERTDTPAPEPAAPPAPAEPAGAPFEPAGATEPHRQVVPESRPPDARRAWNRKLRWFAGQILVVVTGILVALALDAWWDARQDAARERAYLRQLDADLAQTDVIIDSYDRFLRPVDSTAALLVRAYRTPAPPPEDSLYTWLLVGSRFGVPRPVVGTAEALVTTGDLALVRNDSLRIEIVSYLEYNRALLSTQDAVSELWRRGFLLVNARVDVTDLALEAVRSPEEVDSMARVDPFYEVPAGARLRPFPVDAAALLQDRQVYEGLWTMNSAKRNLASIRAEMRDRARRLRSRVRTARAE